MGNNNQLLTFVIIGVAAYFLFTGGVLDGLFSSANDVAELYPSDLKTTITLNTGDKLATTATAVTTDYFVFTSSGDYLKGGATSSGTASFTVPTGGNYKIIAFLDSGTEYLAEEVSFSTDGADPTKRAVQTVNIDMYASSTATIDKVRSPVDLNSSIDCGAGQVCHFDILISTTTAYKAVGKPVIQVDVNSTEFDNVIISGLTSVTCPSRLSTSAGRVHYCFETGKNLLSSDGVIMYTGSLYAASTAPASESTIVYTVMDKVLYAEPDYKTKGYSAFKYATENPIDHSNIGAADSSTSTLYVE